MIEKWKKIPGFPGYEASVIGNVKRTYQNGRVKVLTPYKKQKYAGQMLFLNLVDENGKRREKSVAQLVYYTFVGKVPEGKVVYHKNGMCYDNRVDNLGVISPKDLGKNIGKIATRKTVVKIDMDGNDVEYYPSASEAARKCFLHRTTITDRCNGRVKNSPAADGYEYAWDDSAASRRWAIRRIERSKEYVPPMKPAPKVQFDF